MRMHLRAEKPLYVQPQSEYTNGGTANDVNIKIKEGLSLVLLRQKSEFSSCDWFENSNQFWFGLL